MSMSSPIPIPIATEPEPANLNATQNNEEHINAEMHHDTSSVIANARKVFGSSSLPTDFGKYDSFYSSLRDSEIDQRQKHLDTMEQMRQYRGDALSVGGRQRKTRPKMRHIEGELYPEPEVEVEDDVPPLPTDDEGNIIISKVNFPDFFRTPPRNYHPVGKLVGSAPAMVNPSDAESRSEFATGGMAPVKDLLGSFTEKCSVQSRDPNISKQPLRQENSRSSPVPTTSPRLSDVCSEDVMIEQEIVEAPVGALGEAAGEHGAAPSSTEVGVQEHQLQCEIDDSKLDISASTPSPRAPDHVEPAPYPECYQGAMTSQVTEEAKTSFLNDTADEVAAAALGIKESVSKMSQIVGDLLTITDPYAECSPGAMAGQGAEEGMISILNNSTEEYIAAALSLDVGVHEDQLQCEDVDRECSQSISAGKDAQEEMVDTNHEPVEEHIDTALSVEVSALEHQLQCEDDKSECSQGVVAEEAVQEEIVDTLNEPVEEHNDTALGVEVTVQDHQLQGEDRVAEYNQSIDAGSDAQKEIVDTLNEPDDEHIAAALSVELSVPEHKLEGKGDDAECSEGVLSGEDVKEETDDTIHEHVEEFMDATLSVEVSVQEHQLQGNYDNAECGQDLAAEKIVQEGSDGTINEPLEEHIAANSGVDISVQEHQLQGKDDVAEFDLGAVAAKGIQEETVSTINKLDEEHNNGISGVAVNDEEHQLQDKDDDADCSQGVMAGKVDQGGKSDALNESVKEQTAAALSLEVSVQENRLQCLDDDAECSQGVVAGEDAQEESVGSPNELVEEHSAASLNVEVSVQDHQLQCLDDASKLENEESANAHDNGDSALSKDDPCLLSHESSNIDDREIFGQDPQADHGVQEETFATLHDPVGEHDMGASSIAKVNLQEQQLQREENATTFENSDGGESIQDEKYSADMNSHVAEDDVSSGNISCHLANDISEIADMILMEDEDDVPSGDIPFQDDQLQHVENVTKFENGEGGESIQDEEHFADINAHEADDGVQSGDIACLLANDISEIADMTVMEDEDDVPPGDIPFQEQQLQHQGDVSTLDNSDALESVRGKKDSADGNAYEAEDDIPSSEVPYLLAQEISAMCMMEKEDVPLGDGLYDTRRISDIADMIMMDYEQFECDDMENDERGNLELEETTSGIIDDSMEEEMVIDEMMTKYNARNAEKIRSFLHRNFPKEQSFESSCAGMFPKSHTGCENEEARSDLLRATSAAAMIESTALFEGSQEENKSLNEQMQNYYESGNQEITDEENKEMVNLRQSEPIDINEDQVSDYEGQAESTEVGRVPQSFEPRCEAALSNDHIKTESQIAESDLLQATPVVAAVESSEELQVEDESLQKQTQNSHESQKENTESIDPNETLAPTTPAIITQITELDDGLLAHNLPSPEQNIRKQSITQEDTHCVPTSTPPTPVSHHKPLSLGEECRQGAIPLEPKTEQHLEPPSKISVKNSKSTASWKRKSKKGINLTPLKKQKLDELRKRGIIPPEKNPWGTGVQLYNGRSVERVSSFTKCKNRHCKWEPQAHSGRGACERCWTLASRWEREEFIAKGRQLRISKTTGGCPPACTLFPGKGVSSPSSRKSGEEAVRLCRRCFNDVHHVGIR